MSKKLKLARFLLFLSFIGGLVACEIVDLDSEGKPIIPMSEEEASLIINMEPIAIAIKLWPRVESEFLTKAVSSNELDFTQDSSTFISFDAVVSTYVETALGKTLTVKVGDLTFPLQLGPRIKGNAIRDSLEFVRFDQFKNQVQFAKFSKELNKRAVAKLPIPDAGWIDQRAAVVAAITLKGGKVVSAIPLRLARTQ